MPSVLEVVVMENVLFRFICVFVFVCLLVFVVCLFVCLFVCFAVFLCAGNASSICVANHCYIRTNRLAIHSRSNIETIFDYYFDLLHLLGNILVF